MDLSNKNRKLFIDQEAVSALDTLSHGLLFPINTLMNQTQAKQVIETKTYKGISFPFPFILAPAGKKNYEVLSTSKQGEVLDLYVSKKKVGTLVVEDIFKIDPKERVKHIYGTDDPMVDGVLSTLKRLGTLAVSGPFSLNIEKISILQKTVLSAKEKIDAKNTTAIMIQASPLHRAHEKLIRHALDNTDLIVLFLLKPYESKNILPYDIRKNSVDYFISNYLPKDRIVVVPLEYTYIFAGQDEIIINSLVAKNFGCNRLMFGKKHTNVNYFLSQQQKHSIVDTIVGHETEFAMIDEYVFCDMCRTFVSTNSCPHGDHHHILYHSETILELLNLGIMPPAVLMRKEISAIILSKLFPNRFKNLEHMYYQMIPNSGLLEEHDDQDFYIKLMELYQTTSLN